MKKAIALVCMLPLSAAAVDFVDGGLADPDKVELGKLLFFDKELSGNRNISCGTCHHVLMDTGDGLSLPVGEGGVGLGVTRDTGSKKDAIHERVPRNAPPVVMLGSTEVTHMFHDGRIEPDPESPSGFKSPAGDQLPEGLENILAVQAMFPVTSAAEMAGQESENPVAKAAALGHLAGSGGVWDQLAKRLQAIPAYVDLFVKTFDDVDHAEDITYVHAANAIGAFEIDAWRADHAPWDAYQAGNAQALNKHQLEGSKLFFGKAGCSQCHSGDTFSDMQFHAIAMPQIGPGKGDNAEGYFDGHDDFGRERVTGERSDRYKFRTPPLRNAALTAPYGHSGAYDTLEDVVLHHLDPGESLWAYYNEDACRQKPRLPSRDDLDEIDCDVMDDEVRVRYIYDAYILEGYEPVDLSDQEVRDLIAFLHALTDPDTIDLRRNMPSSVPSGLPLAD